MVNDLIPQLTVTRPEPLIWTSRLLILDSIEPWKPIRDIPLHRGLNIVWSVDIDRDDDKAPVMTGHGVGKTTFCRLLRFCLGEATFGRKSLVRRIRSAMPMGYAAAQVHVAGQSWSVARPLGRSHHSYAVQGRSIEDLFSQRPSPGSYQHFLDAVRVATLPGFLPDLTLAGNRQIQWDHLLAWCARDQEARYQNFWDWRSARSESQTPAFVKDREDPMLLVRAAIGLVTAEEIRIKHRLIEIDHRSKEVESQIADRLKEPEFQVRRLRRELVEEFNFPEAAHAPLDSTDLFSVSAITKSRGADIGARITVIDGQLAELNRQLLALQVQIEDADQIAGEWEGSAETTDNASATVGSSVKQLRETRESLKGLGDQWCRYGGVALRDCQHVQDRIVQLDGTISSESGRIAGEVARRDQMSAEMRGRAERVNRRKQQLVDERDRLLASKRDLEHERYRLNLQSDALPMTIRALEKWNEIITGKTPDESLTQLREETALLESEATSKSADLAESLAEQAKRLGDLQRVFAGLVSVVLSPEFRGTARIRDGEIECAITHGSVLAGEAVETLAVLLTDVTCLLLGVEGNCLHPGIHIHDSPREADLGARIYRRFLEAVCALHRKYGGDSAPFQYIVTTTTAPPQSLQSKEFVTLRLSNEKESELMFRRSLGAPLESAADSLFESDTDET